MLCDQTAAHSTSPADLVTTDGTARHEFSHRSPVLPPMDPQRNLAGVDRKPLRAQLWCGLPTPERCHGRAWSDRSRYSVAANYQPFEARADRASEHDAPP